MIYINITKLFLLSNEEKKNTDMYIELLMHINWW